MTKVRRRCLQGEVRPKALLPVAFSSGDRPGEALTRCRRESETAAATQARSLAPNGSSLAPWQRAMLLASLRHEEVGNILLHKIVAPTSVSRLSSVPLIPLRARRSRLASIASMADAGLDTVRRFTAIVLFWLAHRALRSAVRLYFAHLMTAGGARVALSLTRALERAGVAVMFGSRGRRRMRSRQGRHS